MKFTKEEKRKAIKSTSDLLNQAKSKIANASQVLESNGLYNEAEQLMKIVYRIEAIQNK